MKGGAALGIGLAAPTIITKSAWGYTNEPTGSSVTLGFNVPQTGAYADEGADELRAYQLAVEHLNGEGDGGMLNTFSSKELKGDGVLGKKVEYVTGDTQTKSDAARASAKRMIEADGAVMITGGSSSGVAIAVQGLCQEAGVIFMAGLTHSNDTTGKDKKANGFRHFFNAYAGENVKGIFGSTNWHWSLQDEGSQAFVKSFGQKYGFPPSQAAHTCYAQALLYADACQRAGTFNPCGVVEALEGFEFDGLGNGPTLYRAEDHQCFKDVLVVKGKDNPTSEFDLLEVVDVTPASQVTYAPDHPMFAGGSLGECNPGA
ncbi:MAG: ABC transporter substrate-binding protein [Limibacillus sp.]